MIICSKNKINTPSAHPEVKIRITGCKDSLLWYKPYVGKEFNLVKVGTTYEGVYWTREPDYPFCLNWVRVTDAELISDKEEITFQTTNPIPKESTA